MDALIDSSSCGKIAPLQQHAQVQDLITAFWLKRAPPSQQWCLSEHGRLAFFGVLNFPFSSLWPISEKFGISLFFAERPGVVLTFRALWSALLRSLQIWKIDLFQPQRASHYLLLIYPALRHFWVFRQPRRLHHSCPFIKAAIENLFLSRKKAREFVTDRCFARLTFYDSCLKSRLFWVETQCSLCPSHRELHALHTMKRLKVSKVPLCFWLRKLWSTFSATRTLWVFVAHWIRWSRAAPFVPRQKCLKDTAVWVWWSQKKRSQPLQSRSRARSSQPGRYWRTSDSIPSSPRSFELHLPLAIAVIGHQRCPSTALWSE